MKQKEKNRMENNVRQNKIVRATSTIGVVVVTSGLGGCSCFSPTPATGIYGPPPIRDTMKIDSCAVDINIQYTPKDTFVSEPMEDVYGPPAFEMEPIKSVVNDTIKKNTTK